MAGDYFSRLKFMPCVLYLFIYSFIHWTDVFFPFLFYYFLVPIHWMVDADAKKPHCKTQANCFVFFFAFLISREHLWNRYVSYACRMLFTAARFYIQISFWTFIFRMVWAVEVVNRGDVDCLLWFFRDHFFFFSRRFFFLNRFGIFIGDTPHHSHRVRAHKVYSNPKHQHHMPGNDPIYH